MSWEEDQGFLRRHPVSVLIVVAIILIIAGKGCYSWATDEWVEITVIESERVQNRLDEGSRYLVFCEEEVFENTDAWFWLKFTSSDIYRDLKLHKRFKAHVYGWRIPFLSWYRNIIEIEPLPDPEPAKEVEGQKEDR